MTTCIDTNVIVALWDTDNELNRSAALSLEQAAENGDLLICGAVYSELLAMPSRDESFMDVFLSETRITVDWTSSESIWRLAGNAFQAHVKRRRKQKATAPRRILADFFIGAHAATNGHRLLTLDSHHYRSAFPALDLVRI